MRRSSLALIPLTFAAAAISAQTPSGNTRMLRAPTVSATDIAFAYANNIWVVPRAGGNARRLTSFAGATSDPHFSPDGRWIAFSAQYGGNTDVYVVPAEGGEPKRLTWHPAPDYVQGWTPDGKSVVFASTQGSNLPSPEPRWFTVPAEGGVATAMPMLRAWQGHISPDGTHIAYRMNNAWDEERRNYRGGQSRPIWILDLKTLAVDTVPRPKSKEMEPVWASNDMVYFLSDRDGVSNVWSYDRRTKAVNQVTRFSDFDVKTLDANANGSALVFEQGGYVHELDPASGREHVVPITATGDFAWMMPQWKEVSRYTTSIALSPTAKRAAIEARGEIFTVPAEKGDVRNLTQSSGSAERAPAWSPDGKYVSYFSDKSGEYQLVIASADGSTPARTIALAHPTHYYTPSWAPDGKHIVFQDTDERLWVVDVATGKAVDIGGDEWMVPERSLNPRWSPDSRWIAYAKRLPSLYRAIFVYDTQTGATHQVTDGLADATWPAWDASGKYLWFFASTDFALGSGWLDMSSYGHGETDALYLAVLRKSDPSPLLPESDEDKGLPFEQATPGTPVPSPAMRRQATADTTAPAPTPDSLKAMLAKRPRVEIDFDGLQQRVIAVPGIAARDYAELQAGAAGTVYFIENLPQTGTQEAQGPTGGTLHRYQLKDRKAAPYVQNVAQYFVSADGKKLLYRTPGPQGALFLVDAGAPAAPAAGSGKLNAQLRMLVDPRAEFAQIFNEGWRNQRDYLYVKNLQGTDWPAMKKMYGQLLPYVNHRDDLNYLLDEMGAEIAIGHSFVRGGDMPDVPQPSVGLLGADFAVQNGRYRITKIYGTDSWNPDLRAPLTAPGVDVHEGDYVLAVNGEELRAPDDIYRLFDGTANHQTTITVSARPSMDGARRVTVVPVASDVGLRARAWVEHNRHVVDSLSHGQLAYVHLPNTGQGGYTSFNRYYFAQQDRKGAVIDERYNGGGSAADYIIDVLQRKFDGYFNNPVGNRTPFTSPAAGIWGPKVMIINEMSGSGGDLMPYMFQERKVGPLVGERTWGGLVGIWDTPLFVDGGIMYAPRGGFFDTSEHWAVENVGTSPDIEVEDWPKDLAAGHDAQLEAAVAQAMKMLAANPVQRATHEPPPPTWGKREKPIVP